MHFFRRRVGRLVIAGLCTHVGARRSSLGGWSGRMPIAWLVLGVALLALSPRPASAVEAAVGITVNFVCRDQPAG